MCGSTLDCFAQRPIWAHVHILGQARTAGAVLPDPLPEGEQEVGAVLMLEQQVG